MSYLDELERELDILNAAFYNSDTAEDAVNVLVAVFHIEQKVEDIYHGDMW